MPRKKPLGEVVRKPEVLTDGRTRLWVVGIYTVSEEHSAALIEMIVEAPWYVMRDFNELRFFTPGGWDSPPMPVRPQFFLDETGEELVGSYLHPPPIPEQGERTRESYLRRVRLRFAFFVDDPDWGGVLLCPLGRVPEVNWEPIPERLLRLVWLDL